MEINDDLLTIDEAAAYLKVHRETIRRWHLKEGLKGLKRGKTLRFFKKELIKFLQNEK